MALKLGSANISAVKLGSANVSKMMLGSTEVWPVAAVPWTPADTETHLWIDSADTTKIIVGPDPSRVAQITDKSGKGRNITQVSAGYQPYTIPGGGLVMCDAGFTINYYLSTASVRIADVSKEVCVICVADIPNQSQPLNIQSNSAEAGWVRYGNSCYLNWNLAQRKGGGDGWPYPQPKGLLVYTNHTDNTFSMRGKRCAALGKHSLPRQRYNCPGTLHRDRGGWLSPRWPKRVRIHSHK